MLIFVLGGEKPTFVFFPAMTYGMDVSGRGMGGPPRRRPFVSMLSPVPSTAAANVKRINNPGSKVGAERRRGKTGGTTRNHV